MLTPSSTATKGLETDFEHLKGIHTPVSSRLKLAKAGLEGLTVVISLRE